MGSGNSNEPIYRFSKSEYMKLIAEVKRRPCLWKSDDYHEDDADPVLHWQEISAALNVSEAECKRKWRNLRDAYQKKIKNKTKSSPWIYFRHLHFLQKSKAILRLRTDGSSSIDEIEEDDIDQLSSVDHSSSADYRVYSQHHLNNTISKNRIETNRNSTQLELKQSEENVTNPHENEDYKFFLSLIPYVNQLDSLEKLQLRSKIMNCVIEAVSCHNSKTRPGK